MNYQKIYDTLIRKRVMNIPHGYSERHHIVPVSWGGTDLPDNLVRLTAREHRLAHLLLMKTSTGKRKAAMAAAVFMIKGDFPTSRAYESARIVVAERMSKMSKKRMTENNPFVGKPSNIKGMKWITNGVECRCLRADEALPDGWEYGRKYTLSEEGRKRKGAATTLMNRTRVNPNRGKTWAMNDAGKKKISDAAKKNWEKKKAEGIPSQSTIHKWVKDRVWMFLGGKTKMVPKSEVPVLERQGWQLGRFSLETT